MISCKKIPNSVFFDEVEDRVRSGQDVKIMVKGVSMSPTFLDGRDFVVVSPIEKKLRRGDIVLFHIGDSVHLHRIIHIYKGTRVENAGIESRDSRVLKIRGDGCYSPFEVVSVENPFAVVTSGSMFGGLITWHKDSVWWKSYTTIYIVCYPLRWFLIKAYHFLKKCIRRGRS